MLAVVAPRPPNGDGLDSGLASSFFGAPKVLAPSAPNRLGVEVLLASSVLILGNPERPRSDEGGFAASVLFSSGLAPVAGANSDDGTLFSVEAPIFPKSPVAGAYAFS